MGKDKKIQKEGKCFFINEEERSITGFRCGDVRLSFTSQGNLFTFSSGTMFY
jgi:hypothetical protein